MYWVIPIEPNLPDADMAVLFMSNEGYSTMYGHAVLSSPYFERFWHDVFHGREHVQSRGRRYHWYGFSAALATKPLIFNNIVAACAANLAILQTGQDF